MRSELLDEFVADILSSDTYFLDGLHRRSTSFAELSAAIIDWSRRLGRPLESLAAGIEPAFRQSILFSLIPEKALMPGFSGSYDAAIEEHASNLGITLSPEALRNLRDLIINAVKLRGLTAEQARTQTAKLRDLKADFPLHADVVKRQNNRCVWCGVDLDAPFVKQSLEHMLPKHLGDDLPAAKNWAISCSSCNSGKRDSVAWATSPWAYDYFERTDFERPGSVSLQHRWAVLCRDKQCSACNLGPSKVELFVFKRVGTGLAIPSNCGTVCASCAPTSGFKVLEAEWVPGELQRG